MKFGEALELLEKGQRVARSGWNGKGMWLAISPGVKDNPWEKFWSPAIRTWALKSGVKAITVLPYIVMFTATREIVPWLASQTDLLADDWVRA